MLPARSQVHILFVSNELEKNPEFRVSVEKDWKFSPHVTVRKMQTADHTAPLQRTVKAVEEKKRRLHLQPTAPERSAPCTARVTLDRSSSVTSLITIALPPD